jgi:hypothetical protein
LPDSVFYPEYVWNDRSPSTPQEIPISPRGQHLAG